MRRSRRADGRGMICCRRLDHAAELGPAACAGRPGRRAGRRGCRSADRAGRCARHPQHRGLGWSAGRRPSRWSGGCRPAARSAHAAGPAPRRPAAMLAAIRRAFRQASAWRAAPRRVRGGHRPGVPGGGPGATGSRRTLTLTAQRLPGARANDPDIAESSRPQPHRPERQPAGRQPGPATVPGRPGCASASMVAAPPTSGSWTRRPAAVRRPGSAADAMTGDPRNGLPSRDWQIGPTTSTRPTPATPPARRDAATAEVADRAAGPTGGCLARRGAVAVGAGRRPVPLYAVPSRTVVTTRVVSSPGQATANLTGCPVDAACCWSQLPDGGPLFGGLASTIRRASPVAGRLSSTTGSAHEYLVDPIAEHPVAGIAAHRHRHPRPGRPTGARSRHAEPGQRAGRRRAGGCRPRAGAVSRSPCQRAGRCPAPGCRCRPAGAAAAGRRPSLPAGGNLPASESLRRTAGTPAPTEAAQGFRAVRAVSISP